MRGRNRSVYAHGVHLRNDEFRSLAQTGSAIAFCPTSNMFLGSGLFNLQKADFVAINPNATDLLRFRMQKTSTIEDKLCVLHMLGDDRAIDKTYVMGKQQTVSGYGSGYYEYNYGNN